MSISGDREEKMTQGWVVYGGKRHAEPQREMFSRSYKEITRLDSVNEAADLIKASMLDLLLVLLSSRLVLD
jgi:hypothetical protein